MACGRNQIAQLYNLRKERPDCAIIDIRSLNLIRLLVACKNCNRQYDATAKEIGSFFHCHCGHRVEVPQPRCEDAAIVRCSSCGAPREADALSCGYCHADFTLHERDLNTICPGCLARISDKAKFCHHCGQPVLVEMVAGAETDFPCPACEPPVKLQSRKLGALRLNALECQVCAGLWLGLETFDWLRKKTEEDASSLDFDLKNEPKAATLKPQRGKMYRYCPLCRRMMVRRNYGKGTGVIVDVCRQDGIWFDDDELRRVLKWISEGRGLIASNLAHQRRDQQGPLPPRPALEEPAQLQPADFSGRNSYRPHGNSVLGSLIEALDLFFD